MTQLNTPYPSTAYITGFLRSRGIDADQDDLALKLVLRLFSGTGLAAIHEQIINAVQVKKTPAIRNFCENIDLYLTSIDRTIAFLQGRDATLAHRINTRSFLPEGPRFETLDVYESDEEDGDDGDPMNWAFGALGVQDDAVHLSALQRDRWGAATRAPAGCTRLTPAAAPHVTVNVPAGASTLAHVAFNNPLDPAPGSEVKSIALVALIRSTDDRDPLPNTATIDSLDRLWAFFGRLFDSDHAALRVLRARS